MGALTSKERQGLDDIFLSIHTTNTHTNIIKHIIIYFMKALKVAKLGVKKGKFYKFILIFSKKKKSLSK